MSADEIRKFAERPSVQLGGYYSPAERTMIRSALLAYAAMVERCEKMMRPCNLEDAPCVPSDTGYCDSCDVPRHNEMINYILRGDAGEGEGK